MTSQKSCSGSVVSAGKSARKALAGSGPNSIARLVAACPASSQAGPVDVSTQSTTPEIWPALHSRLRWLKSRCKKVGRYAGGSSASTSKARCQESGCAAQPGITHFSSRAQDWKVRNGSAGRTSWMVANTSAITATAPAPSPTTVVGTPGSRDIRCIATPATAPSASRQMLRGAGTGVVANSCNAARSRRVSSRPWVRHGSFVINRSTACCPEASVSASIVEVIPPDSSTAWVIASPRTASAQACTSARMPATYRAEPRIGPPLAFMANDRDLRERRGVSRLLELRALAPRYLLQFKGVAVRVGEVCSFDAASEVLDFTDLYTSADELGTRLGDVLHNEVQASDSAGFTRVHIQACPETDRTGRAVWCQLDDPHALAGLHVNVLLEAELVSVEGDGSVYVRNRERDQFQPHLHRIRTPLDLFSSARSFHTPSTSGSLMPISPLASGRPRLPFRQPRRSASLFWRCRVIALCVWLALRAGTGSGENEARSVRMPSRKSVR